MTSPGDRPPAPRAAPLADRTRSAFAKRRALALFVAAGIAAVLALTSGWWLPALPEFLGFVEDNSEVISPLLSFAQLVVPIVWLVVSALLWYLGYRRLQSADTGGEAR